MIDITVGASGADLKELKFDGSNLTISIDTGCENGIEEVMITFENVQIFSFEQDLTIVEETPFNSVVIVENSVTLKRVREALKMHGDFTTFHHYAFRISDVGALNVVCDKITSSG